MLQRLLLLRLLLLAMASQPCLSVWTDAWTWDCLTDGVTGVSTSGVADSAACVAACSGGEPGLHMWLAGQTRSVYQSSTLDLTLYRDHLTSVAQAVSGVRGVFHWYVMPDPCGCSCNGCDADQSVWVRYRTDTTGWTPEVGATSLYDRAPGSGFSTDYVALPAGVEDRKFVAIGVEQANAPTAEADGWFMRSMKLQVNVVSDAYASLDAQCPTGYSSFYRAHYRDGADIRVDASDRDHWLSRPHTSGTEYGLGLIGTADTTLAIQLPATSAHSTVHVVAGVLIDPGWDNNHLRISYGGAAYETTFTVGASSQQCFPDAYPCGGGAHPASEGATLTGVSPAWRKFTIATTLRTSSTAAGSLVFSTPAHSQDWALADVVMCIADFSCDDQCNSHGECTGQNTCQCDAGYKGDSCDEHECNTPLGDCKNGGTCPSPGAVQCTCPGFHAGDDCSHIVCNTELGDCRNGVCPSPGATECSCPPAFAGVACERFECAQPCQNGGTCPIPGGGQCDCPDDWTGIDCATAATSAGAVAGISIASVLAIGGGVAAVVYLQRRAAASAAADHDNGLDDSMPDGKKQQKKPKKQTKQQQSKQQQSKQQKPLAVGGKKNSQNKPAKAGKGKPGGTSAGRRRMRDASPEKKAGKKPSMPGGTKQASMRRTSAFSATPEQKAWTRDTVAYVDDTDGPGVATHNSDLPPGVGEVFPIRDMAGTMAAMQSVRTDQAPFIPTIRTNAVATDAALPPPRRASTGRAGAGRSKSAVTRGRVTGGGKA